MTLKQLEAFFWTATCASFSVAAERLYLSASSLSKRVVELEQSLGCTLFDRQRHRVTLTEAGERLLPRARELLRLAQETRNLMGGEPALQGRCRFGVGDLSALTWLPRLVARARERHPALLLEPHVEIGERLERGVDSGELDFAVIAGLSSRSSIASQQVAQVHYEWTVAPRLAPEPARVEPELLRRVPLICLPQGSGLSLVLDGWMQGRDVAPQRLECNDWGAIVGLVVEGVGIGLMPRQWAYSLAAQGRVAVLQGDAPLQPLIYSCQYRRDDTRPLVRGMLEIVRESVDFSTMGYLSDIRRPDAA